jgi:hypothetical protein
MADGLGRPFLQVAADAPDPDASTVKALLEVRRARAAMKIVGMPTIQVILELCSSVTKVGFAISGVRA